MKTYETETSPFFVKLIYVLCAKFGIVAISSIGLWTFHGPDLQQNVL